MERIIDADDEMILKDRIQGFGNDPQSCKSREKRIPDAQVIPEADYLWHALVDVGETLGMTSVLEAVDYVVQGCGGKQHCTKPAFSRGPVGVATRLKHWGPGTYRIVVKDVAISSRPGLGGDCIANLQRNDVVEVQEVVYRPADQRLRGRIEKGWISLLNTEDGSYWVSKEKSRAKDEGYCRPETEESQDVEIDLDDLMLPRIVVENPQKKPPRRGYAGPMPRIPPPPGVAIEKPGDLIDLESTSLANVSTEVELDL